jgi:hypothetical protein
VGAQTRRMPASQYPSEQSVKNSKVWAFANFVEIPIVLGNKLANPGSNSAGFAVTANRSAPIRLLTPLAYWEFS